MNPSFLLVSSLSVDVSADLERRLQLEEDGLREEDLARLEAQPADLVLGQLHILAGPRSSHCKKRGKFSVSDFLPK